MTRHRPGGATAQRRLSSSPRRDRQDNSETRLVAERMLPRLANDSMDRIEPADPIDPIDSTDPTDPIERTEPVELIDSTEPRERIDSTDPRPAAPSAVVRIAPTIRALGVA